MSLLISALYIVAVSSGAAFALMELRLLWRFVRHRVAIRDHARDLAARASRSGTTAPPPPRVTIQIPVYNERTAVERIVRAAAAQDYPREFFDVQVLDDSTDETSAIVARVVQCLGAGGVRIEHLCREHRRGFKAGALAAGLERTDADFVAVFDADFAPDAGFLTRVLLEERVFDDPQVAFVQTRWAFDPPREGILGSALALLLDRHFFVQKPTRAFMGHVTTFNGSGGVWRRSAIVDAGGWSADTLTEDLDLSFRCALRGWKARYLQHVAVESELPSHMRAFKVQQLRWARGNAQCFRKLTRRVLGSRGLLRDRWEEAFLLAGYAIHPILLANLLLWPWAVLYVDRGFFLASQAIMTVVLSVAPISFVITLRERGDRWSLGFVARLLAGLCVGIGLMVNNTVGQVLGLVSTRGGFARTPKGARPSQDAALRAMGAERPYALPLNWTFFIELLVIAYALAGTAMLAARGQAAWSLPLVFWATCLGLVVQLQVAPQPA